MQNVVLVPGTMGSILKTPSGDEIWPPTAAETQLGYNRVNELLRSDLVVGDIIRKVLCFGVYKPLIEQLNDIGFKETGSGKRLHIFPYDWRKDIEGTADLLAQRIEKTVNEGATSVTIVAHSMGGLLARLVLESGKYDSKPWFKKITSFMALATPHLGAPLALARILGMDSTLGISAADFRKIASDRRYPSGYQLLPAPGEAACWDIGSTELQSLDIYDATVAGKLGLDTQLLARARFVHDTLAKGKPPMQTRYFYFAGTGHKTTTRINVTGAERRMTRSDDAGDGTVPMWSALPKSGQKQLVPGEHASFFTDTTFKAVFYRLLGKSFPTPPLGAAPSARLSVQSIVIKKTDEIELLLVPSAPMRKIAGKLVIERADEADKPFTPFGAPVSVAYEGPATPWLKLHLPPTAQPGLFNIRFDGNPAGSGPALFAVSET